MFASYFGSELSIHFYCGIHPLIFFSHYPLSFIYGTLTFYRLYILILSFHIVQYQESLLMSHPVSIDRLIDRNKEKCRSEKQL